MNKREFLKGAILFFPATTLVQTFASLAEAEEKPGTTVAGKVDAKKSPYPEGYDPDNHLYGMGIEIDKCIGCNRCAVACKAENNVPPEPYYFRTWVERYAVMQGGESMVECISLGDSVPPAKVPDDRDVLRTFFVPKLCNQCAHPPCVQVCPVGATFSTKDGVVLVDKDRCIGCRYCIQACPYGARYLDYRSRTADKCTFCYHRITKGLLPACVEACPTQARIFGDLRSKASRLVRFQRMNKINALKPGLNTEPKVTYAQLDGEVR